MKNIIAFLLILVSFYTNGQSNINIIESNNRFAFDVYNQLNEPGTNLIFSPASITSAVAMTTIGANGNTYDEISSTFYFTKDRIKLGERYLNTFGARNLKSKGIKLYNANSLWIEQTLDLNKSFTDENIKYFNSSLHNTDFLNNPEESRNEINNWVAKNTNNRIKDLLKPSVIDESTRLVLVNALYFKGAWSESFNKSQNTEDQFQTGKRDFVTTTFMNKIVSVWYYSDKCIEVIDIPYEDQEYSLMIVIPKSYKKLKRVEKLINYDFYTYYTKQKEMKTVDLSVPKFSIESEFDLNGKLQKLGMKEAFTGNADFSGITKQEKLYISKVIHKANISVDEDGTEAAAATAVTMRKTSISHFSEKVKVDKPFIFILRNNANNLIYFMGKITNPEK
ncbi:MAG: serpin family protein [Bacteroidetes bacterium]|nr:serpin family protein [Bacteroidota bacterium]